MLGKRQHRGEWGVVPDRAKRNYGSRRFEPLPTPHAFWYLALCALVVTGCSSDGRTPLVIYSPHGRDLLTLLERRFEQLHPGVDVRWLDMGSQEVYDRVRSERANPQADVWFGGPATIFARAAADSLLEPYRPSWAGARRADEGVRAQRALARPEDRAPGRARHDVGPARHPAQPPGRLAARLRVSGERHARDRGCGRRGARCATPRRGPGVRRIRGVSRGPAARDARGLPLARAARPARRLAARLGAGRTALDAGRGRR